MKNSKHSNGVSKHKVFSLNERVHVLEHGMGKIIGYVDRGRLIRVEFDSKNVRDFHPSKLAAKLIQSS